MCALVEDAGGVYVDPGIDLDDRSDEVEVYHTYITALISWMKPHMHQTYVTSCLILPHPIAYCQERRSPQQHQSVARQHRPTSRLVSRAHPHPEEGRVRQGRLTGTSHAESLTIYLERLYFIPGPSMPLLFFRWSPQAGPRAAGGCGAEAGWAPAGERWWAVSRVEEQA